MFIEKPSENKFGIRFFQEIDGAMHITDDSGSWNYGMPSRIVKIVYLRVRHPSDTRSYRADRDTWKDDSYMILNEEGNLFHAK